MARQQQKTQAAVTTGLAGSTGIPCAMVLTAYGALSSASGLDSRRRPAQRRAELDPSVGESGPHAFAVRPGHTRRVKPLRPSHSRLNVRDDAYAPPIEAGCRH
jgi:hypothetical protein